MHVCRSLHHDMNRCRVSQVVCIFLKSEIFNVFSLPCRHRVMMAVSRHPATTVTALTAVVNLPALRESCHLEVDRPGCWERAGDQSTLYLVTSVTPTSARNTEGETKFRFAHILSLGINRKCCTVTTSYSKCL